VGDIEWCKAKDSVRSVSCDIELYKAEDCVRRVLWYTMQSGLKQSHGVELTSLSYIPGARIDQYPGHLNFFIIRETTSVREVCYYSPISQCAVYMLSDGIRFTEYYATMSFSRFGV